MSSMKLNISPVVWMDKPDTFHAVGRSLRQAYQPTLTSAPDRGADALMKLLMETPLNDMACC